MKKGLNFTEARQRLRIPIRTFAGLVRAGVFRRNGRHFDPASLATNHAHAIEIQRSAAAQIEAIKNDVARRLAALGVNPQGSRP